MKRASKEEIEYLRREDIEVQEKADKLGVSQRTIFRLYKKHNIIFKRDLLTPEKLKVLIDQGVTHEVISRQNGLSREAVSARVGKQGLIGVRDGKFAPGTNVEHVELVPSFITLDEDKDPLNF